MISRVSEYNLTTPPDTIQVISETEMISGAGMFLVCGRNRSRMTMTEYQEAGCSTGWMQQLETSTLINTNGRYSYTNDKLSNSLATY